ncbi:MAG TPA: HIT domain-containing protein [Fimbriiglobus sp.]|jgi:ATP adenylyltransferase
MDQLWAPWRLSYVTQPAKPTAESPDCFLCRGISEDDDRTNLIVRRTALSVVMLNRFPYNNGHLLIAPQAHKARPADISDAEHLDIQHLIRNMIGDIDRLMKPEGFNVGLNLGKVAGAGLPGHLHWHVVPRWNGDTNFMPVITDTRVIVQSLDSLWELLVNNTVQTRQPK